jgi:uncharacterized protein
VKRAAGLLALTLLAAGVGVGQVTTSNEQHVLLVGDSIMRQTGDALDHQLGDGWRIHNDGVNGSGLLTPDYFDWSDILEQDLARTDPEVVVFLFIGNYTDDPSELWQADDGSTVGDVSSPAFAREWGQEVDAAMATIAEASDAEVVMVLPPPMATPELQGVADALRREYRRAAERWPFIRLVDSVPVLGGPDGEWVGFKETAGGDVLPVRTGDGVHLARQGQRLLARAIAVAVEGQAS